jgi:hypothetical protein
MRFALPLACLLFATGAAADSPRSQSNAPDPAQRNVQPWPDAGQTIVPDMTLNLYREPADCRDRIHTVREERGLPPVERETADANNPLLIKALDQRIGGCSVMVMHNNVNDIRHLPQPHEPRLMRAK